MGMRDAGTPGVVSPSGSGSTVVIGLYDAQADAGGRRRWDRWRPTLSLFQHEDRIIDRFDLLLPVAAASQAEDLLEDIAAISPETQVNVVPLSLPDVDDFEQMHRALQTYAEGRAHHPDDELLVHITTAPYTAQVSFYLLTQAHQLRGNLLQSSPGQGHTAPGWAELNLDLHHAGAVTPDVQEQSPAPAPISALPKARRDAAELDVLVRLLGAVARDLDRFDRVQLLDVVRVCRMSTSASAAGRTLYAASRARRKSPNDGDRLRKYLARFGLTFKQVAMQAVESAPPSGASVRRQMRLL